MASLGHYKSQKHAGCSCWEEGKGRQEVPETLQAGLPRIGRYSGQPPAPVLNPGQSPKELGSQCSVGSNILTKTVFVSVPGLPLSF